MSAAQKTPLAQALSNFARNKAQSQIQLTGKALPAQVVAVDGAIITVQFLLKSVYTLPQIDCPLFGPEYIRYPIQPGNLGVVFPADFYLGGVSGLGGGAAGLSDPGNLSALVFFPIGNKTWFSVDPDQVTIYGPNGVKLMDTGAETTFVLTPAGVVITNQSMFQIVTGSSSIVMTTSEITIQAPIAIIEDATNNTGPSIMAAAWGVLETWLNGHEHTSGAPGDPTSAPITPFSGGSIAPSN